MIAEPGQDMSFAPSSDEIYSAATGQTAAIPYMLPSTGFEESPN